MSGINTLIQRLEKLGAVTVRQHIASSVATVCHDECLRGFREQRDPYGIPWKPRKSPAAWAVRAFGLMQQNHPLLDKTGAMINSLTSRGSGGRVLMRILGYAKFHQSGTATMTARKIFPDPANGLGTWREPVEKAALSAVRELMNGRSV